MVGEALSWRGEGERHFFEITEWFDTQRRYETHKKVEIFEWWVLKTVAKQVECRELRYFNWRVMINDKKKNPNNPKLHVINLSFLYSKPPEFHVVGPINIFYFWVFIFIFSLL